MKLRNFTDNGVTLIELMVTIVVVAIFSPMLFTAFSGLYKQYYSISQRTENVLSSIKTKRIMDIYWSEIDSVISLSSSRIVFRDYSEKQKELTIRNNDLLHGNRVITTGVLSGKFSYLEVECSEQRLLKWEIRVPGCTISGVCEK